jgi:hypothetical protein
METNNRNVDRKRGDAGIIYLIGFLADRVKLLSGGSAADFGKWMGECTNPQEKDKVKKIVER